MSGHGTTARYGAGCRCDDCREAWAKTCRDRIERRALLLDDDDPRHGLASTYGNYKCRCPECSEAKRRYDRARNAKRKAAS